MDAFSALAYFFLAAIAGAGLVNKSQLSPRLAAALSSLSGVLLVGTLTIFAGNSRMAIFLAALAVAFASVQLHSGSFGVLWPRPSNKHKDSAP